MWEGMINFQRYDSPQGGLKVVRKVCLLMERYRSLGRCDSCQEV